METPPIMIAPPKNPPIRVMIVDWDVHHGDGTQSIFEDDPRL